MHNVALNQHFKARRHEKQVFLPDHPVHDEHVAQKSHHADDGVESRDADRCDQAPGAPGRTPRPGAVLQPVARLLVREGGVVSDDGVEVGQVELSSRDGVRLHAAEAAALSAPAAVLLTTVT